MAGGASEEDKHSKTEAPTQRRLDKAREQGDVPASREAGTMMTVLGLLGLTVFLMPQVMPMLAGVLSRVLSAAGTARVGEGQAGLRDLGLVVSELSHGVILVLAPVMGLMVLAAMVGVLIQGQTVVAVERLRPKLSKISPAAGLKKMISPDALVEFGKSVAKVLVVGALAVWLAWQATTGVWQTEAVLPEALSPFVGRVVARLLTWVSVFMVAVALADILFKRFRWYAKQRMSVKEVRDEMKEQEGDPLIKGKRMEIRRARARQRMAAAVPGATVVLTNPTHYAVALRYEAGADAAPVCVAKGVDLMAARIRALAKENEVPVVENRPLARALYDVAEIDRAIPVEHWQAVAEIIGFVLDLRRNVKRKAPAGSSLRDEV
ncbi:flagellar type III secretion system protein FlhB [Aquicoccus sp. SCR17]|nr:flagellar type III secretion system protein FlhB [Carideicomes alvinocaridis]